MKGSNVIETLPMVRKAPQADANAYLLAFRADQSALVLTLEQVNDHTVVSPHISFP